MVKNKKANSKTKMNKNAIYAGVPVLRDATKNVTGGFPTTQDVTLKYCETVTINCGAAGALGYYSWRANSLFDPNLTGVGHQPMGRDAWSAIYSRYVVMRSRCIATYTVASSATDAPTGFGLLIHETGSLSGSGSTLMEQGRSVYRVVSSSSASNSNSAIRLFAEFDTKKWFGIKDVADNSDTFGAVVGSNPSQTPCFVTWIQDLATAADLPAIYVTVEIEYDVHFTCPMEQVAS